MGRAGLLATAILATIAVVLSLAYTVAHALLGATYYSFMNQIGPAVLFVSCLWAAYSVFRSNALAVWTPAPWFMAACGVYFGFGPLAYHFATAESVAFMDSYFPVDELSLFQTNLLNSIAISTVSVAIILTTVALPVRQKAVAASYDRATTKWVMWLFLIVGGIVKYLFSLPYALRMLEWTLPGVIQHLSSLLEATIILLFVIIHRGEKKYRWLLYALIISEFVTGLMMFNKMDVALTVIAIVLGLYLCRPSLKLLVGSGIALMIIYVLILSPFVSFARIAVRVGGATDLQQLGAAVEQYRETDREDLAGALPGVQGWWTRLSYANTQTFAMQAYDSGVAGETLALLPWVFVPRAVYSDKPILLMGQDFDERITGKRHDTSTGVGVFAEAYWNGGWAAVVGVCLYLGALFVGFGRFAMDAFAKQRYGYVPVVMMGVVMGLRPDGWFVPEHVGAVVEAIFLFFVLRVALRLRFSLVSLRRPAAGTA